MTWILWWAATLYMWAFVFTVYGEHKRRKDHEIWLERKMEWAREVGLADKVGNESQGTSKRSKN